MEDSRETEVTGEGHSQARQKKPGSSPMLSRLDALVGEWDVEVIAGGQLMARNKTAFAWLEGGAFLRQDTVAEPALPGASAEWKANAPQEITALFGLDDGTELFSMLYADSRDVFRVYQMTLGDGVWKIWRDAPGFCQRFTGTFGDDGNTITAQWEISRDCANWEHDFDLIYRKVASAEPRK